MTTKTETQLLQDVAATKSLLERLINEWDDAKGGFASCAEVQDVKDDLKAHIDHHKWSIGQAVAVVFGAGGLLTGIAALFVRRPS